MAVIVIIAAAKMFIGACQRTASTIIMSQAGVVAVTRNAIGPVQQLRLAMLEVVTNIATPVGVLLIAAAMTCIHRDRKIPWAAAEEVVTGRAGYQRQR